MTRCADPGPTGRTAGRLVRRLVAALATFAAGATGLVVVMAPNAAAAPTTTTFSFTGPPVAIPDAADLSGTSPGAQASASVTASGLVGVVTDVDFRIDGASCDATAGSTTVGLDHPFVNDLVLQLQSPTGTVVTIIANTDGSGNNLCQVVLDDETANPSIQSVTTAQAPFTGTWQPANPLSAFDGEAPNGSWSLLAQDFFAQDTGNIRAFSVILTTDATNAVSATKTVSGTMAEGGTVTYTVVSTNSGNTAAADNPGNELTDVLPSSLTLVSATATSGTAVATIGTNTVTWNGGLPAGGSVTVTITATVGAGTENDVVSNQATLAFDADVNGTNESSTTSDDPAVGGANDSTSFTVAGIPPTVTVEQAAGQGDPTDESPILFTAIFSEPVTGLTASDVTIGGTAGATTSTVTGSGATYTISVSGMTSDGTVTASLPAGAAADANGNGSLASTSTDDTVTLATANLSIRTTHTGDFTVGVASPVSIVVTNDGPFSISGPTSVSVSVPASLIVVSLSGTGWMCTADPRPTCTRSDAIASGASFPAITVLVEPTTVSVAGVVVSATVDNAADSDATDNTDRDTIVVRAAATTTTTARGTTLAITGTDAGDRGRSGALLVALGVGLVVSAKRVSRRLSRRGHGLR